MSYSSEFSFLISLLIVSKRYKNFMHVHANMTRHFLILIASSMSMALKEKMDANNEKFRVIKRMGVIPVCHCHRRFLVVVCSTQCFLGCAMENYLSSIEDSPRVLVVSCCIYETNTNDAFDRSTTEKRMEKLHCNGVPVISSYYCTVHHYHHYRHYHYH